MSHKVKPSPCKLCLVYASCCVMCPETSNYIENVEDLDKYSEEILSRIIRDIEKNAFNDGFKEPTAIESNYWAMKRKEKK